MPNFLRCWEFFSQMPKSASWPEIHEELKVFKWMGAVNFSRFRGDVFELICKISYNYDEFHGRDLGIDGQSGDTCYQVKWRAKTNCCIAAHHVANFYMEAKRRKFKRCILITNVERETKRFPGVEFITGKDLKIPENIVEKCMDFLGHFNFPIKIDVPPIKLRPYQRKCIKRMLDDKSPRKKIIMCCGSGKTVIFMEYLRIRRYKSVAIVVPTRRLCSQIRSLMNMYKTVKAKIVCYMSVADLSTTKWDCVILDEAHRCLEGNKIYGDILSDKYDIGERIFFTATPKIYSLGMDKRDMNSTELYGREIFNYTFQECIRDGYIVPFEVLVYETEPDTSKYNKELLRRYSDNKLVSRYLTAALQIKELVSRRFKMLAYFNSVENCRLFQAILKCINLPCQITTVHSGLSDESLSHRFDLFNNSESGILNSCQLLGEGIDMPCVTHVMFVDPRRSYINIIQCVGRCMRLYPGKKVGTIVLPVHRDNLGIPKYRNIVDVLSVLETLDRNLITDFLSGKGKNIKFLTSNINNKTHFITKLRNVAIKLLDWNGKCAKLELFIQKNGRIPTSKESCHYSYWRFLRNQCIDAKYPHTRKAAVLYQQNRAESSIEQLIEFCNKNGKIPKSKDSVRVIWQKLLNNYKYDFAECKLESVKNCAVLYKKLLQIRQKHIGNLHLIKKWVELNQRLPEIGTKWYNEWTKFKYTFKRSKFQLIGDCELIRKDLEDFLRKRTFPDKIVQLKNFCNKWKRLPKLKEIHNNVKVGLTWHYIRHHKSTHVKILDTPILRNALPT